MQSEFTKPEFISGIRDPTEKPPEDTNDRSWGQTAVDTGIGLVKPVITALRTPVEAARLGLDQLSPEDQEKYGSGAHGIVADVGRGLGSAEKWLDDQRSARDKALDTVSPFPGPDERSFWREPVASTIHQITPVIPYIAGAVLTGGSSVAAQVGTAATFGALGVGGSLTQLRDASENMPLDDLKKLPQWQEFNGDEEAARNKVFKDSLDLKTEAATFGVNALTFGAFLNGLGSPAKKALAARLKNVLIEGGSGAVLGAGQGAVSSYGEELGKVRRGEQENIDADVIAGRTKAGTAFGAPMALYGAVAPPHLGSTPPDPNVKQPPPPPGYDPYGNKIPTGPGPSGYDPYGNPITTPPAAPPAAPPPALPTATKLDTDITSTLATTLKPDAPSPPTAPAGPPPTGPTGGGPPPAVSPVGPAGGPPTPPPMQPRNIFEPPLPDNVPGGPVRETPPAPPPTEPAPVTPTEAANNVRMRDVDIERQQAAPPIPAEATAAGTTPDRRAWLERQLQTEQDPTRRTWLEDQLRRETPAAPTPPADDSVVIGRNQAGEEIRQKPDGHRIVVNPDGTTRETMASSDVDLRGQVPDDLKTAEEVAAGTHIPTPLAPGAEAEAAAVRNRLQERAAQIKAQREGTPVTPEVRAAPLSDTTLGGRLSPEAQQHMRDQATAAEANRKAAVEAAIQAESERNAKVAALQNVGKPPRTGKVKTGVERALEASIKAWKENPAKTPEAWTALRKRAMYADSLREQGGLKPKGYVKQIGERPGATPVDVEKFGKAREIPSLEGERPTPAEAKLVADIDKLRADMQHPTPEMEKQTAVQQEKTDPNYRAPRRGTGAVATRQIPASRLTAQQFAQRIKPLQAEARRLDTERLAAGKPAMFERALPRHPGDGAPQRTVDQQFNEHAAVLDLHRSEPPNQFIRVKAVQDALGDMNRIITNPNEPRPLYMPEWVAQKVKAANTEGMPNPLRRLVELINESTQDTIYQQARKAAGDRLYETTPVEEATAGGQKVEHTGAFPVGEEAGKPKFQTHRQFEEEQARLRAERTADQPEGQKLRKQAETEEKAAEARRKTPEAAYAEGLARIQREKEAREAAAARGEQAGEPDAGKRMTGELPTPAELKAMVDTFWGVAKGRAKGKDRTTATRAQQFIDRDWTVGLAIDETLKKHFGDDLGSLNKLLDRLQIGRKPELPKELKEQPPRHAKKSAVEAHKALRKRYEDAIEKWRNKQQKNMVAAAVELEGVIKNIENQAREYLSQAQDLFTARGGSIHWGMPTGEKVPGTPYTRYKIGVSAEKSDMFNMLADMMTTRDHINVATDVLRGKDNALDIDKVFDTGDQRQTDRLSRDISRWVNQLATDWRNYRNNDLAAIREERSVRNQSIEEQKRAGVQKKAEVGEDGRTDLSDELKFKPLDEPLTPEEQAIEREEAAGLAPKHVETRFEEAARLARERKGWMAIMGEDKVTPSLKTGPSKTAEELRAEIARLTGRAAPIETGPIKRTPKFEHEGAAGPGKVLTGRALERAKAQIAGRGPGKRLTKAERLAQIEDELQRLKITETRRDETGKEIAPTEAELEAKIEGVKKNRRNRPSDGPAPETADEYRAEVHSARDALTTDDPVHPLISDHEPASASIDRAKDIIERGEAADVSDFITPEFLDKLSKVNDGVSVLHAPVEVVRGETNEGQAFYQPNHDRIVLSNNVSSGDYVKNVVHEHVHAATEHLLNTDAAFRSEVEDLRQRAQANAEKAGVTNPRLLYGLSDPHEFLSESQSNPQFRALLSRTSAPGRGVIAGAKNVMNALYRTIRDAWRRVAGEKDGDTALDVLFRDQSTVLGRTDRLVAKTLDRLSTEGRSPGTSLADRRYRPNIGDISRKTRAKMGDTFGSGAMSDILMGLHTTIDFTHRGEAEFQKHVRRIADNMAETQTERTRIMSEENEPKLRETAKWLNALADGVRRKVEQFLHDETMHSAYADVDLKHAKNKHVSETSLADAQIRRMHDKMMERYNELAAQVPEFAEHRKILHDFFTEMENNVRNAVSEALIEHLRIVPPSADTPAKKAAAAKLIQKHVLGEKLTSAEKTTLEAIKTEAGRKNFRDIVSRIRRTPELTRIAGPYVPLTRHGGWATSGHFNMPEGGRDGERLTDSKDREGRPVDDGIRMFETREAAESFEQRMHDKFGMSQVEGGEWFLDKRTGKRAREYTEEEIKTINELIDEKARNRLLKAKEVESGIVEEGPNQYEKKYWVKMQPQLLEFHERKSEAQASADAWRKRHGKDIEVTNPEQVHRGLGKQNEKYASTQMQKLIDRAETAPSFTQLAKDQQAQIIRTLTLQAAKLSLRRGVRQQFKPRGYVAGHDPHDLIKNAYDYSGQTSGYLANTRGYVEKMEARKALDDYLHETRYDDAKTHTAHTQMRDELYRKMDESPENNHENLVDRATNVMLKWSLLKQLPGFSYFTANATEVAAIGAPLMMDRHGLGTGRSVYGTIFQSYRIFGGNFAPFRAMARGIVDAYNTGRGRSDLITKYKNYVNDAIEQRAPEKYKDGLKLFFNHIHRIGLMEPSTGIEYQKSLYNPSANKTERAADWAANVFQSANSAIENLNRFVTGSSAYMLERRRLESEGKLTPEEQHAAAEQYATDIMYRTNGDARNWNKPSLFNKGPVMRLATQYKSFPQRVMAAFIDAAVGTLRGAGQKLRGEKISDENWEKGRRLAALTAVTIGAAGMLGLPTEILKAPLNLLYYLGLSNWTSNDVEANFRQWSSQKFGLAGRIAADGFSAATPINFQRNLSQSNTFFYGAPTSRKSSDLMAAAFGVIMGAGGHTAVQAKDGVSLLVQGTQQILDGATSQGWLTVQKGLQRVLPVKILADAMSLGDSLEPTVTPGGKVTRQPLGPVETIVQTMGFQPQRLAEESFRKDVVKGEATRFTAERSRLVNEWAQANNAQRASISRSIDEFNKLYPEAKQRITRDELVKAAESHKKALAAPTSDLGLSLTARTTPFLRDTPAYR